MKWLIRLVGSAIMLPTFFLLLSLLSSENKPGEDMQARPALLDRLDLSELDERQRHIARQATEILLNHCALLNKYNDDIEWIHATVQTAGATPPAATDTGWQHWVHIELKVADQPRDIPLGWRIRGQRLAYFVGGSPRPGIGPQAGFLQAPEAALSWPVNREG